MSHRNTNQTKPSDIKGDALTEEKKTNMKKIKEQQKFAGNSLYVICETMRLGSHHKILCALKRSSGSTDSLIMDNYLANWLKIKMNNYVECVTVYHECGDHMIVNLVSLVRDVKPLNLGTQGYQNYLKVMKSNDVISCRYDGLGGFDMLHVPKFKLNRNLPVVHVYM